MNKILLGDSLHHLRQMPDESVHSCITSPPYWGLRDYGVAGQMGLEKTPEEFIQKMVDLFREAKRVIRSDGTLWLNIGDSYAGSWGAQSRGSFTPGTLDGASSKDYSLSARQISAHPQGTHTGSLKNTPGIKAKDLVGIPWMLAFALRADGWYLRSDIIWSKPNPMPESVTDRPTKAHEYIFLLSKNSTYYYDADAIKTVSREQHPPSADGGWGVGSEPHTAIEFQKSGVARTRKNLPGSAIKLGALRDKQRGHGRRHAGFNDRWDEMSKEEQQMRANKRSVWSVATMPFKEAHFATFPEKLIEPMILASTPPKGIVLDPFMGAGTTALVAKKLGRQYLGIELNPAYIAIAEKRINAVPNNMFL